MVAIGVACACETQESTAPAIADAAPDSATGSGGAAANASDAGESPPRASDGLDAGPAAPPASADASRDVALMDAAGPPPDAVVADAGDGGELPCGVLPSATALPVSFNSDPQCFVLVEANEADGAPRLCVSFSFGAPSWGVELEGLDGGSFAKDDPNPGDWGPHCFSALPVDQTLRLSVSLSYSLISTTIRYDVTFAGEAGMIAVTASEA
jgi:hypothetical protein